MLWVKIDTKNGIVMSIETPHAESERCKLFNASVTQK